MSLKVSDEKCKSSCLSTLFVNNIHEFEDFEKMVQKCKIAKLQKKTCYLSGSYKLRYIVCRYILTALYFVHNVYNILYTLYILLDDFQLFLYILRFLKVLA